MTSERGRGSSSLEGGVAVSGKRLCFSAAKWLRREGVSVLGIGEGATGLCSHPMAVKRIEDRLGRAAGSGGSGSDDFFVVLRGQERIRRHDKRAGPGIQQPLGKRP